MIEGVYGAIIFGRNLGRIHTFYEIERKYSGRFGSHMVHLRKPLLEWAGNDLIEIEMKIKLQSAWCGDPNPILAEWHFFHENAIAAPLIVGAKPMGPGLSMFVITDMHEAHKHWLPGGRLIGVEIDVTFKEYIPFSEGLLSMAGIPGFADGLIGSGAI
jgi:hypothetical protein